MDSNTVHMQVVAVLGTVETIGLHIVSTFAVLVWVAKIARRDLVDLLRDLKPKGRRKGGK